MKALLKEKLSYISKSPVKDSPAYEYIQALQQPYMDNEEYKAIVGALADKNDSVFALTENARLLMKDSKFDEAIKYWGRHQKRILRNHIIFNN